MRNISILHCTGSADCLLSSSYFSRTNKNYIASTAVSITGLPMAFLTIHFGQPFCLAHSSRGPDLYLASSDPPCFMSYISEAFSLGFSKSLRTRWKTRKERSVLSQPKSENLLKENWENVSESKAFIEGSWSTYSASLRETPVSDPKLQNCSL